MDETRASFRGVRMSPLNQNLVPFRWGKELQIGQTPLRISERGPKQRVKVPPHTLNGAQLKQVRPVGHRYYEAAIYFRRHHSQIKLCDLLFNRECLYR